MYQFSDKDGLWALMLYSIDAKMAIRYATADGESEQVKNPKQDYKSKLVDGLRYVLVRSL